MAQAKPLYFVREATGLVREYGPFTALTVAMNNMIGAGIFALSVRAPNFWPGGDPVLAFVIGLIVNLFIALSYTWVATAMPRSGADYVFAARTLNPIVSYVTTFGLFAGRMFSIGFLLYTDVTLWGLALLITGRAIRIPGLVDVGRSMLTDPAIIIPVAILLLLTIWGVLIIGGRLVSYYMWVIWLIPLIGGLIMIGAMFANPFSPASYKAAWDATWGAGAYDEIVSLAVAKGWKPELFKFDFDKTMLILAAFAMFAYAGFDAPAGFAGEIKRPTRSFYIAVLLACFVTGLFYIALVASAYYGAGEFVSQYNWAYYKARADIKISPAVEPVLPLFAIPFAGGNAIVAFLMAIAGAFALYHVQPAALMKDTRRMFAMAFDRFLPEKLTYVSERLHTPTWIITVFLITGIIGIILASPLGGPYRGPFAAISATFFYIIMAFVVGWALTILPFARPEVYETIKFEYKGIPLTTIVGIVTFGLSFYFFILLVTTLAPLALLVNTIILGLGAAFFAYYAIKNLRKGIDLKGLFYEVPPE